MVSMAATAQQGNLRVKSDVAEATVVLDDREVGKTPLTLPGLAIGSHSVRLDKDGYQSQERKVQIEPGKTTNLFIVMPRSAADSTSLPARFRAVHQHTNGHCLGELVITTELVEYRAADGKDVFSVPIASIRGVSRSTGERWERLRIEHAGDDERKPLACRIETPERAYGFWAYESDGPATDVDPRTEQSAAQYKVNGRTRDLFALVYRLWNSAHAAAGPR